jgi:hypothetical protein
MRSSHDRTISSCSPSIVKEFLFETSELDLVYEELEWLGDRDLNPDKQIQSLLSCRWTIPHFRKTRVERS